MNELLATMNADQIGGLLTGGILGLMVSSTILNMIYWILTVIGNWKIFTKFGEPGWKSIIPVYNSWVLFAHVWKPVMAIVYWVLGLVGSALLQFYDGSIMMGLLGMILVFIGWIINLINCHKLSKSFGHGVGFTIGLVLIPGLFQIILGFGKSEYIGNTSEQ